MSVDPDQRRKALAKFATTHKLRYFPWSEAAGVAEANIRGFLKGRQQSLGDRTYELLAQAASELLNRPVTAAELRGEAIPGQVKVESFVGAGYEVRPIDGDSLDEYRPAPPSAVPLQAAIVRGDSGLPMFEDGNVLFYSEPTRSLVAHVGEVVIADLADGRRLVKRLQRGQKLRHWHLFSINPASPAIENVLIESVAPILWVMR